MASRIISVKWNQEEEKELRNLLFNLGINEEDHGCWAKGIKEGVRLANKFVAFRNQYLSREEIEQLRRGK